MEKLEKSGAMVIEDDDPVGLRVYTDENIK